ncbi:MAG: hypothetical protein KME60_06500 [Cyanomargarita calcarea GSE-NOS-MK-12-04C]|jgi:tetratricopeptide (TPR) repeat protein|uniref:Uncharacterized protein n=1 Tax=Cyanomargarita calcarea GSE-NOS-MK-12-04C TaxID=2839659 RepID=A0A951URV6_9CYAN|nr:hypothetical protein [Cyanomargarita calcarea GSE-NOS-MK-12-04C]
MKLEKIYRTFFLTNIAIASLIMVNFPAMATSVSISSASNRESKSVMLLAGINTKYVQEADKNLDAALEAMSNAAKTENEQEAASYFDNALQHLQNAATALKQGGMLDTALMLENAIQSLNYAIDTDSDKTQDKLIEDAINALNRVDTEIKDVLS